MIVHHGLDYIVIPIKHTHENLLHSAPHRRKMNLYSEYSIRSTKHILGCLSNCNIRNPHHAPLKISAHLNFKTPSSEFLISHRVICISKYHYAYMTIHVYKCTYWKSILYQTHLDFHHFGG